MRAALPYPFDRLRRVSRGEASRRTAMARLLDVASVERAAALAGELLHAEVEAKAEPVALCPSAMLDRVIPQRCAAFLVAAPDDPLRQRYVAELDSTTARALADRLLGAEPVPIEAPLGEGEIGVALYLAARLLGELTSGRHRVLGVITSREAVREALGPGDLAFWPVRVAIGAMRATIRVWRVDDAPTATPAPSPHPALGAIPLGLRLLRGRARLTGAELESLGPDDVLLLDEATSADELFAEVAGSKRVILRCRLDGGRVVVQEVLAGRNAGARRSNPMSTNPSDAEEGLARAGDAEIELSVDVARVRIRLSELARLRPGEVLGTAVGIGERVRLRAGDVDVAEGELVDVEGKVGVLVTAVFPGAGG